MEMMRMSPSFRRKRILFPFHRQGNRKYSDSVTWQGQDWGRLKADVSTPATCHLSKCRIWVRFVPELPSPVTYSWSASRVSPLTWVLLPSVPESHLPIHVSFFLCCPLPHSWRGLFPESKEIPRDLPLDNLPHIGLQRSRSWQPFCMRVDSV